MSFKFIITFFVFIGLYLCGLGIACLIKYLRNKHKFKKEKEKHENVEGCFYTGDVIDNEEDEIQK